MYQETNVLSLCKMGVRLVEPELMTSKVLLILANRWVPWDCGISKGVCLAPEI